MSHRVISMPWVTVEEPFAKPPRVAKAAQRPEFSGQLSTDRGWADLEDVSVSPSSDLALDDVEELAIKDSSLSGVVLSSDRLTVEVHRSHLQDCDLSGLSIRSVRGSRFVSSKLIGTDFSGGTVADVVFERCVLRYANLRMAKLSRVAFIDCTLDDVDCYELEASDITFPGTELTAVSLDSLKADNLDLREATQIELTKITGLEGCLVAEHQLIGLAHSLAMAAGVQVERHIDATEDDR